MSIKVTEFIVKHLPSKKYQEKMVSLLNSTNMGERQNDNSTGAQLENGKGDCTSQLILRGHHFLKVKDIARKENYRVYEHRRVKILNHKCQQI